MSWFPIQIKPREAARAEEHLKRQGYKVFRPMVKVDRRKVGKEGEEDAFPGYQFVSLVEGESDFESIRSTRGVIGLVRLSRDQYGNRQPTPVPDRLMDLLQTREIARKIEYDTGDTIRITKGPFEGYETVIEALKTKNGEQRVIALLNVMNGVSVELGREEIEPVNCT